jgi:hypothetical protein
MTDHSLRPKDGFCWKCGGAYMTLGMRSRWVPHAPGCPRLARLRPQSATEADREREALADPSESPFVAEKGRQTYFRARSWWEQDVDLGGAV